MLLSISSDCKLLSRDGFSQTFVGAGDRGVDWGWGPGRAAHLDLSSNTHMNTILPNMLPWGMLSLKPGMVGGGCVTMTLKQTPALGKLQEMGHKINLRWTGLDHFLSRSSR